MRLRPWKKQKYFLEIEVAYSKKEIIIFQQKYITDLWEKADILQVHQSIQR